MSSVATVATGGNQASFDIAGEATDTDDDAVVVYPIGTSLRAVELTVVSGMLFVSAARIVATRSDPILRVGVSGAEAPDAGW